MHGPENRSDPMRGFKDTNVLRKGQYNLRLVTFPALNDHARKLWLPSSLMLRQTNSFSNA